VEDLSHVIGSFQTAATVAVQRHGGFVARYMGDGLLAYFGWPNARESDAECAVRAGLAVVEAVAGISAKGERIQVRVGIASGLVVVGDIGTGSAHEHAALGEPVNIAARLQALTQAGTVCIAHSTRAQIGNFFECADLGAVALSGYCEPIRAWRVDRESPLQSRFEALHTPALTPTVGRTEEIELLVRRWSECKQGEARMVLLVGEAGIGKSRVIAELEQRLKGDDFVRLRYFCAPHREDSALYPVIRHLEHVAGFNRHDAPQAKLDKLRSLFGSATDRTEADLDLLSHLLSIPAPGVGSRLSPQRRKEKTFEVLIARIERLAAERPLLIEIEDMHWSDPTTIELFDLTLRRLRPARVMVVMTFRPDFPAPWVGDSAVSLVTLSRLDQEQAGFLVGQIAGAETLPPALVARIVRQSEGVPLFLEELTKATMYDPGFLAAGKTGHPGSLVIPDTLQASLMARLDRFPLAKEVAQIAAALGREFSHGLLCAVTHMPLSTVLKGLEQLIAAGVVHRHGAAPDATYTFKHALIQETAYESLMKNRRRAIHARIVEALLERDADAEQTQPALLGHHCAQAGLIEKAATYYRRAGERSAERAAITETLEQIERGLSLVNSLPESDARHVLEVELKLALGRILLSTKGSADAEAGAVFEQLVERCRRLDNMDLFIRALWGHWFNKAHRRELTVAERAAQELLALSTRRASSAGKFVAHGMLGIIGLWRGHFEEAQMHLEQSLDLSRDSSLAPLDLAIVSDRLADHVGMQLALTLACRGHVARSKALAKSVMDNVLSLSYLPSQAIILAAKCRHDWFVRDDESLRGSIEALMTLSEEQGFPFYLALAQCHLGWLEAKDGHVERGLERLRQGLKNIESTDALIWQPYLRGMMADAEIWAGNCDRARQLLDDALEVSTLTEAGWFRAELYRRHGEIVLLRQPSDREAAEAMFETAIDLARRQSATLWELRAATQLAALWSAAGLRSQTVRLLESLLAKFPDTDRPEVAAAASLRDACRSAEPADGEDRVIRFPARPRRNQQP
jgi:tetratricopeptide (TPR) repeat protein